MVKVVVVVVVVVVFFQIPPCCLTSASEKCTTAGRSFLNDGVGFAEHILEI